MTSRWCEGPFKHSQLAHKENNRDDLGVNEQTDEYIIQEATGSERKLIWAKPLTYWTIMAKALDPGKPQLPEQ